jgi:hypothetical protein
MSLAEAVERAGSFEALRPHLREGRIPARHNGIHYWPEGGALSGPGDIDPGLWAKAQVEPDIGQAIFTIKIPLHFLYRADGARVEIIRKGRAIDIELERAAVDTLFPVAIVSAPQHAGGRDPDHNWEDAARHVDDWVAAHGPLPRHKNGKPILARAVELMTEWFEKNEPPPPQERSFRRWIHKNPHSWWGPN